jgi:hypothetical protein
MRVENLEVDVTPAGVHLAGTIRGNTLFWDTPPQPDFEPRGEPFVAALLPAAMRIGAAIELPEQLPIDPVFRDNIALLQQVFTRWFDSLQPVSVHATVAPRSRPTAGHATGYSGGIDSSYSIDVLADRIDAALLIEGIEYPEGDNSLSAQVATTLDAVLSPRRIALARVVTNVKAVQRRLGARWSESLGGAIASCVHMMGFADYQIAASNSWENLRPYGSHPLTDPLWSSSTVRIGHHGAELRRIDKIRYLGGVPDLLARVRVCFQGTEYNCGRCQKCLQTAAGFRALDLHAESLPHLEDPRLLRGAAVEHDGDLVDWLELEIPGLARHDPELYRELERLIRRYRWRKVGRDIDQLLTGGRVRRYHRRRRDPAHG